LNPTILFIRGPIVGPVQKFDAEKLPSKEPLMADPTLFLTDAPDDAARSAIGNGLADYNAEQVGYRDSRPLAVLVRDAGGQTLGGILGRTSLGLLFLDLVFLPKEFRGHDLGSRMLRLAEEEGARRGCRAAMLFTISFQAPGFYERHGWSEFGRIPCDPPGTSRIFMSKVLAAPAPAVRS
jgi:GNAT superfamily N-acetyltransferase